MGGNIRIKQHDELHLKWLCEPRKVWKTLQTSSLVYQIRRLTEMISSFLGNMDCYPWEFNAFLSPIHPRGLKRGKFCFQRKCAVLKVTQIGNQEEQRREKIINKTAGGQLLCSFGSFSTCSCVCFLTVFFTSVQLVW